MGGAGMTSLIGAFAERTGPRLGSYLVTEDLSRSLLQRKDRRRTAARICANAVICGSLVIVRDDNGGNRTRAGAIASDHHLARRQTWRNELDATSKKCGSRRARMLTIAPKRETMRPDAG